MKRLRDHDGLKRMKQVEILEAFQTFLILDLEMKMREFEEKSKKRMKK